MRTIRASEIGTFLYCARAWWYQRTGVPSANQHALEAGSRYHQQHGKTVARAGSTARAGAVLLLAGLVLLAAGITWVLLGN